MNTLDVCNSPSLPGVFTFRVWELRLRLEVHEGINLCMLKVAEVCQRQLEWQGLPRGRGLAALCRWLLADSLLLFALTGLIA